MAHPPKLELTLNDLLTAPLRALRIGHIKLLGYSAILGALAYLCSITLHRFLFRAISELEIKSAQFESVALNLAAILAILVGVPVLLTGIAVPVRAIWSYSKLDLLPLLTLTPGALYRGVLSLAICIPEVIYTLIPSAACYYIAATIKARSDIGTSSLSIYLLIGTICAAVAIKKLITLALALALSMAAQVDIRAAYPAILRIKHTQLWQLIILLTLALIFGVGAVYLAQQPHNITSHWEIPLISSILIWYFIVCLTVLSLKIGSEA